MNLFPAFTAPQSLIFPSNLRNTNEVALVANLSKTYLARGTVRSVNAFLPKVPIALERIQLI